MVGMLGLCGIMGAVAASGVGKLVPRFGIRKFNLFGAGMQIIAWAIALLFGDTYAGLIAAIILVDIGLQCQQLSNQSGCLQEVPQASNRANTIFMTSYFIGGSLGTFCAGYIWTQSRLARCLHRRNRLRHDFPAYHAKLQRNKHIKKEIIFPTYRNIISFLF